LRVHDLVLWNLHLTQDGGRSRFVSDYVDSKTPPFRGFFALLAQCSAVDKTTL
jgi:hypothetical protein